MSTSRDWPIAVQFVPGRKRYTAGTQRVRTEKVASCFAEGLPDVPGKRHLSRERGLRVGPMRGVGATHAAATRGRMLRR